MIRVGITGLRDLTGFDLDKLKKDILKGLKELTQGQDRFIMLNSVAAGADQLCAQIGLSLGFELVCPLPFKEYRNDFSKSERQIYDGLIKEASSIKIISESAEKDEAYLAAGRFIVRNCDVLVAVWDGQPQKSICGTQAVITYASIIGRAVKILP